MTKDVEKKIGNSQCPNELSLKRSDLVFKIITTGNMRTTNGETLFISTQLKKKKGGYVGICPSSRHSGG